MLRLTGALLIGAVCAWYGFLSADRLKRRRTFLNEFIASLNALETEIAFGRYELGVIFGRLDEARGLFGLYGRCAALLETEGIRSAWHNAVREAAGAGCLKKEDIQAIESLGSELGMSDVNGQKKVIERVCGLLEPQLKNAEEDYKRLGRVYRSCGILAGIFVVISVI